ncbi:MAG: hypothetical protein MJZ97_07465 [Bacteroidales bacterium]|nr:hypothetical protein [Bacteroidales bacterium]
MSDQHPFAYYELLEYKKNDFSKWAADELGVKLTEMEPIEPENLYNGLEFPIANYITQYDGESFSDEELVKRYLEVYTNAKKDCQGQATVMFGLQYALHLKDKSSSGPTSIACQSLGKENYGSMGDEMNRGVKIGLELRKRILHINHSRTLKGAGIDKDVPNYLTAIRTKPFILLAGISGTGKSRIVRKLAQATDDIDSFANDAERFSCHTPANFCLIQVKPNWHNSMDVVGFKSNIGGEHYEYTPFIEFVAKAWQHQNTPFFLCLDEMNLAPVEEYFAEFLSAIESRSVGSDGEYETDPIIKPFDGFGETVRNEMLNRLIGTVNASDIDPNSEKGKLVKRFREKGLTLPKNLIVMGTVNMDETTFSFSRKVLDRAMSIEMNEVNYDEFLSGTAENDIPVLVDRNHDLVNRFVSAQEVKDFIEAVEVKDFLVSVNALLEGTPFKLGYRAANEAMLYVAAAKTFGNDNLASALDDFTMMKILSRIEGDESKLRTKDGDDLLYELNTLFKGRFAGLETPKTLAKLEQMQRDLKRDHFVSFWG